MYFWIWMSPDSLRMGWEGEGEGWRESDKGALLLISSSLWGAVKHRPLAQLGHSCTPCATRKTKTHRTAKLTWLITLFSPLANFSSLFSCLALWNTKGNVRPGKLGIMTFWAGQLLVSGHTSPRCLKTQVFSFSLPLSGFLLSSSFQPLLTPGIEAAHFVFCVFTASAALSHNWEISDLEKARNGIQISKDFLLQMSRCPFKRE